MGEPKYFGFLTEEDGDIYVNVDDTQYNYDRYDVVDYDDEDDKEDK